MKFLLDTNILIYALANQLASKEFITTHLDLCFLSQIFYLVTRNLRDFQTLDNLKLRNPFDHV